MLNTITFCSNGDGIQEQENLSCYGIAGASFFNKVSFLVVSWNDIIFSKNSAQKESVL